MKKQSFGQNHTISTSPQRPETRLWRISNLKDTFQPRPEKTSVNLHRGQKLVEKSTVEAGTDKAQEPSKVEVQGMQVKVIAALRVRGARKEKT